MHCCIEKQSLLWLCQQPSWLRVDLSVPIFKTFWSWENAESCQRLSLHLLKQSFFLMWLIIFIDLHTLHYSCSTYGVSQEINCTWQWCATFSVYCSILLARVLFSIMASVHQGNGPVSFFFCASLTCFWCQNDVGIMEGGKRVSVFGILEELGSIEYIYCSVVWILSVTQVSIK